MDQHDDAGFHTQQTEEVDHGLLEPPPGARWAAVVSRFDGFGRVGERGVQRGAVEDAEEQD